MVLINCKHILNKVKASTLIEVIIAMVILLTISGITLVLFQKVLTENNNELRVVAEVKVSEIIAEFKINNSCIDEQIQYKGLFIEKKCIQINGMYLLSVKVRNIRNMVIYSKKVYIADYEN